MSGSLREYLARHQIDLFLAGKTGICSGATAYYQNDKKCLWLT
jgi:hypothetical protein